MRSRDISRLCNESKSSKETVHFNPSPTTLIQISCNDAFKGFKSQPVMGRECQDMLCQVSVMKHCKNDCILPLSVPVAFFAALSMSKRLA